MGALATLTDGVSERAPLQVEEIGESSEAEFEGPNRILYRQYGARMFQKILVGG